MSYKTSYSVKWEENFVWLTAVKPGKHSAHCKLCCKDFKIDGGRISQIKGHAKCKAYLNNAKSNKRQRTFASSSNFSLSKLSDTALAPEEQVVKAEITQALKIVASNSPFSVADGDNKRFPLMFPCSKVVQSYKQSSATIKFVIQHGIVPFVVEPLLKDFENKPFTFIFDETATSQIRNS